MKKVAFTSSLFYYLLVIYLFGLLSFNIYWTMAHDQMLGFLPITVQSLLLYLIFSRNKYVKQAIIIWALIFVIVGPGLVILGNLLTLLAGNPHHSKMNTLVTNIFILSSGILVLIFTRKTIIISKEESDLNQDVIQNDGF